MCVFGHLQIYHSNGIFVLCIESRTRLKLYTMFIIYSGAQLGQTQDNARDLRAALTGTFECVQGDTLVGCRGRSPRKQTRTEIGWNSQLQKTLLIIFLQIPHELSVSINCMDSSHKTIKTERTIAALSWTQTRI